MSLVSALMPSRNLPKLFTLLTVVFTLRSLAHPITSFEDHARRELGGDNNNNNGANGVSLQAWIPIIVVALVLAGFVVMKRTRRSLFQGLATMTGSTLTTDVNTREVTAEQLASGISAPGDNDAGAGDARPARRPRRTRRTPSQISTKSLPAYNKEPGDEELVIFRGPQEMEDGSGAISEAAVLSVNEQDTNDSYNLSGNVSMYREHPDTPHDMPLLHNNETHDNDDDDDNVNNLSTQNIMMPNMEQVQTRRSVDTMANSDDTNSSIRVPSRTDTQDPRGEAPPYFEAVSSEQQARANNAPQDANADVSPSPAAHIPRPVAELTAHRRSGLRGFFHALSPSISRTAIPMGSTRTSSNHTRNASDPSVMSMSSEASHSRRPPGTRSQIYNGSTISVSPFRDPSYSTLNSSQNRMNSPSLISLNSISAPLTHTLVRTEFTYPKSGPTPQQLTLISSRESFARFGVPYGADAIAYAASSSRFELDPPPGFDTVANEGPSHGRNGSTSSLSIPEPTHRRNPSADSARFSRSDLASNAINTYNGQEGLQLPPDAASTVHRLPSPLSSAVAVSEESPPSTATAPATPVPPSSFLTPGTSRPQSRASSVQTFHTAADNLEDSEIQDLHAESSGKRSTPSSPPVSHSKDQTDTTITPGTVVVS